MRWLLLTSLWMGACRPVDTERLRIRGNGLALEVVARSSPEQVHMRRFEISVEPAAAVLIECDGDGVSEELHVRELDRSAHFDVSLFGLLAETQYDCEITASRDEKTLTGELSFTTERQRARIPELQLERAAEVWGAYTIFNTWQSGGGGSDHQILIVDDQARVRWHQELDDATSVGLEVRPMGPRSLLIGGGKLPPHRLALGGTTMWSFPDLIGKKTFWHHEAHPTPHGTVLGLLAEPNTNGVREVEGFRIVERDPVTDTELWSWDSQTAWDAGVLPTIPGDADPWHANAASWVGEQTDGHVVLSLPGIDRVLRIDPRTDQVLDQLGWGGDFAMSDPWFSGQHDPEWDGDRVLLHDNGVLTRRTRIVELALDGTSAEVAWEWTEPGWYEPLWGDADRLPDGSILVARGHCGFCPDAGSGPSSVRMVEPATGAVSFDLSLPDRSWAIYRAERVDGCDLFDLKSRCETR